MNIRGKFHSKKLDDLDEEPDNTAILKVVSWGERGLGSKQLAMSMSIIRPGQSLTHHKHPKREEIYILLKGKSLVLVENEKPIDAEAYEFFWFDKGVMHSVRNNSRKDAHWLFISRSLSKEELHKISDS